MSLRSIALFAVLVSLSFTSFSADVTKVRVEEGGRIFELSETDPGKLLSLLVDGKSNEIGSCSRDSKGSLDLPSAGWRGEVLIVNCGATVDFATQVIVTEPNGVIHRVAVYSGQPDIKLTMRDGALSVLVPPIPDDQTYLRITSVAGLNISYDESVTTSNSSDPKVITFASLNFGATGRASGLPAEVLVRMAGWSQEASGLHRDSWGHWSDFTPGGDDPEGAAAIKKGFQYFDAWRKSQPRRE